MTTFEYDGSGRLVSAVTVREAEFSAWDRAVLVSDWERSKARVGRHGRPLSESLDPANQFAYEVHPPVTDWAQKKLNEAQEAYKKKYPQADMDALLWEVTMRES